ncbi:MULTISPECIES: LuxR C-terminal-related transcriptional regulator [unclassified Streptomyces]|uniref:LuxR family transcriptional regulator AbsR2 n=1 Tax=unclassified Streptomyces TaxID=2593676 RepID=UPI0037F84048
MVDALPWPFTGRDEELDLVRGSFAAGRPGLVLGGPAGVGRTRLAAEALRGTDAARVAGTPETRGTAFGAFAHLLPEGVTLHRAVRLLSAVRLLLVDDAHLLDAASAALVHQLAVQGRTRLLVLVADGAPAPGAVTRLWTGGLLPRLDLEPLSREDTGRLLEAAVGVRAEPFTARRLHDLAAGDLRLLRDLLDAVRGRDAPARGTVPERGARDGAPWAWRGPLPVTPALRERAAAVLDRPRPDERDALDRLAFAEPRPRALPADGRALRVLEDLEAEGLVHVEDDGTVRLAHPLHGPLLRAAAGRLRARRLTAHRPPYGPALDAEAAAVADGIARADVRTLRAPVGEWLVTEGEPVPAAYAAARARWSRLRGALHEAAAWAREGLATSPADPACRSELASATAQSGGTPTPAARTSPAAPDGTRPRPTAAACPATLWSAAARGDLDTALADLDAATAYDAVRLGAPERAAGLLPPGGVFARHADALARADGPALDAVAAELEARGFLLFAAEASAQAAGVHRAPGPARTARTRAVTLARRCQGARTPALAGLVLGELTARQRQIVTLAATGLSNRQIAERLTLSVRTVGNHLYGAYTRLGAADRTALPPLVALPRPRPRDVPRPVELPRPSDLPQPMARPDTRTA